MVCCLRSLREHPPSCEWEVIVVDNGSTDGTVEVIGKDFPEVNVIANKDNRGFAAANNQGMEVAKGDYISLLNPDTIVHPDALDKLVNLLDSNPHVGVCGTKLLNGDETIQRTVREFPSFRAALYRYTIFKLFSIFRNQYRHYMMFDFDYDKQADVDEVTGAALMIRRPVVEQTGGMDERFFMYYEEVDLCYRVKEQGWRVVFTPDSVITHLGGQSSEQIPVKKRIMMVTSMLKFFRKHRGKPVTGLFNILFKPAMILREICNAVVGLLVYAASALMFNRRRRLKAIAKVESSLVLLTKYSWRLLFKM